MSGFSYTAVIMQHTHPPILDIQHAANTGAALQGLDTLSNYKRILQESQGESGENVVKWTALLELRSDESGEQSAWLRLTVDTALTQICQRCLLPVQVPIRVDRQFRFVPSEAVAEQQDEQCEEDLLVTSRAFDLTALIEDEALLELPLVPRHDQCPVSVKTVVIDEAFGSQAAKPNPFAALAKLKDK